MAWCTPTSSSLAPGGKHPVLDLLDRQCDLAAKPFIGVGAHEPLVAPAEEMIDHCALATIRNFSSTAA
jgi:hypothetical protein